MVELRQHEAAGSDTSEMHRQAYNAAFQELGLNWHWDERTFAALPAPDREGVRTYLETQQPHLLRAYEADFLVHAIETAKSRCFGAMTGQRAGASRVDSRLLEPA